MTLLKSLTVTLLGVSLIALVPGRDAEAGSGGAFVGGLAVGAAGAIIGHKIYKHQKRKKARRYYNSKKRYKSSRRSGVSSAKRAENADIQKRLNALGFDAGSVDGVMGRRTRAAIRSFQAANGRPVTGNLSNQDITLLYQQSQPLLAQGRNVPGAVAPGVVASAAPGGVVAPPVVPNVVTPNVISPAPAIVPNVVTPAPTGVVAGTALGAGAVAALNPPAVTPPVVAIEPVQPSENIASTFTSENALVEPVDEFDETPRILGLAVTDKFKGALATLEAEGYSNCEASTAAIFCDKKTGFGADKVTVAATSDKIHTITRVLSFDKPVARETVVNRLPNSYKPLLDAEANTVAASPACGALLSAQPDAFDHLAKTSESGAKFDANATAFSHACKYYYTMDLADEEKVSSVGMVFFDSSPILASLAGGAEAKSSDATDEIKF